ncbi:hypothetical protein ACXWTF_03430 [Thiomicrolovo sp. ZZH C-3]
MAKAVFRAAFLVAARLRSDAAVTAVSAIREAALVIEVVPFPAPFVHATVGHFAALMLAAVPPVA